MPKPATRDERVARESSSAPRSNIRRTRDPRGALGPWATILHAQSMTPPNCNPKASDKDTRARRCAFGPPLDDSRPFRQWCDGSSLFDARTTLGREGMATDLLSRSYFGGDDLTASPHEWGDCGGLSWRLMLHGAAGCGSDCLGPHNSRQGLAWLPISSSVTTP
jgi:hypothetical protein